jgi:hypothetical protein
MSTGARNKQRVANSQHGRPSPKAEREKELRLLVLKTIEDLLEGLSQNTPITPAALGWRVLELGIITENELISEETS